jgi:hypothetical protein
MEIIEPKDNHELTRFQFTKYSFIDALWSLIPIFSLTTFYFGCISAEVLRNVIGDCEMAYRITKWAMLILIPLFVIFYLSKIKHKIQFRKYTLLKRHTRILNLAVYTCANSFLFINLVSENTCCYGQSDSIFSAYETGPIASLFIPLTGIITDLYRWKVIKQNRQL